MRRRLRLDDEERVQLATRIPKAIHRQARLAAFAAEQTLEAWVVAALAERMALLRGAKSGSARDEKAPGSPKVTEMPRLTPAS